LAATTPVATEVEHVVPLTEGGPDDESNLAPIHEGCHREKTQAESRRARP
jgi:5-methylcytosine-specific restriction protein A